MRGGAREVSAEDALAQAEAELQALAAAEEDGLDEAGPLEGREGRLACRSATPSDTEVLPRHAGALCRRPVRSLSGLRRGHQEALQRCERSLLGSRHPAALEERRCPAQLAERNPAEHLPGERLFFQPGWLTTQLRYPPQTPLAKCSLLLQACPVDRYTLIN